MSDAEVSLPGVARSVPQMRQFVRQTLASWHLDSAEPTASLVVSELVGNAVLHARSMVTVRLRLMADVVRIEVHDASPRFPALRHYTSEATTGRGLALVAAVSRDWGVEATPAGKAVWCEIDQAEPVVEPINGLEQALDQFPDVFDDGGATPAGLGNRADPLDRCRALGTAA